MYKECLACQSGGWQFSVARQQRVCKECAANRNKAAWLACVCKSSQNALSTAQAALLTAAANDARPGTRPRTHHALLPEPLLPRCSLTQLGRQHSAPLLQTRSLTCHALIRPTDRSNDAGSSLHPRALCARAQQSLAAPSVIHSRSHSLQAGTWRILRLCCAPGHHPSTRHVPASDLWCSPSVLPRCAPQHP